MPECGSEAEAKEAFASSDASDDDHTVRCIPDHTDSKKLQPPPKFSAILSKFSRYLSTAMGGNLEESTIHQHVSHLITPMKYQKTKNYRKFLNIYTIDSTFGILKKPKEVKVY